MKTIETLQSELEAIRRKNAEEERRRAVLEELIREKQAMKRLKSPRYYNFMDTIKRGFARIFRRD